MSEMHISKNAAMNKITSGDGGKESQAMVKIGKLVY